VVILPGEAAAVGAAVVAASVEAQTIVRVRAW